MKTRLRFLALLMPALLALAHLAARGEDIDLFAGTPTDATLAPNLLLVIDNGSNFNSSTSGGETAQSTCRLPNESGVLVTNRLAGKVGGIEQCALYHVINTFETTDVASVNIGVMMFAGTSVVDHQGRDCAQIGGHKTRGGCLVYPIVPLTTANKTALLAWIAKWNTSNSGGGLRIDGDAVRTAASMQEAWAYFSSKQGISGRTYTASDLPSTQCKNFVVYIGNAYRQTGSPKDSDPVKAALERTPATNLTEAMWAVPPAGGTVNTALILGGGTSGRSLQTSCGTLNFPSTNNHENAGYYADEWARYMLASEKNIKTFTVGLIKKGSCTPEYPWLLFSMADAGEGQYFEVEGYQDLVDAINNILSQIRSVNSVFAAVSLPVSVNSQGTYLNQVFIGMFRPDRYSLPRWNGNLKQYKMGFDSNNSFTMLDADDKAAISSSGSEFVAECARSFWTPTATTTGDGYFTSFTTANCSGYPAPSNSPDGNIVEKGGQGYMLRKIDHTARIVKTCSGTVDSCQTTLTDFHTSNASITAASLSISSLSTPTVADLINWARGSNNHPTPEAGSLNNVTLNSSHMRPSSHGDVVHSRPAAVNFGTDASPKVVVFYGGNDGMLRAINGNRTTTFTVSTRTIGAGDEFWSFLPPEYYGKLIRRYQNTDGVYSTANPTGTPKDYAMDGPITAYRDGADAWVYVGMRRGGRSLYAFHVNGSTLAITLAWKIGCSGDDASNCSDSKGDYTNMGQTWSTPQVVKAKYNSGTVPLVIVGGGYDASCEDAATYTCGTAAKGRQLYVLNAFTGERLASLTTARSVIADVTVVPDADGFAKYIYTADLGGNIYRIQGATPGAAIDTTAPGSWTMSTVASLGCADLATDCGGSTPTNRKFMFAPDVVVDGENYILLLGSGDRERPTNTSNGVNNHFFAIKDLPSGGAAYLADTTNCGSGATKLCLNSLLSITQGVTPSDSDLATKKGWYLNLKPNEQVVTGAIAVFGVVYFTTHEPKPAATNSCVPNLGTSRSYGVKYTNASSGRTSGDLFIERADAGLAPDLVVGKVTLDNDQTVPFCIGCDGPIKPSQPPVPGLINNPAKIRSYWYIQR